MATESQFSFGEALVSWRQQEETYKEKTQNLQNSTVKLFRKKLTVFPSLTEMVMAVVQLNIQDHSEYSMLVVIAVIIVFGVNKVHKKLCFLKKWQTLGKYKVYLPITFPL